MTVLRIEVPTEEAGEARQAETVDAPAAAAPHTASGQQPVVELTPDEQRVCDMATD